MGLAVYWNPQQHFGTLGKHGEDSEAAFSCYFPLLSFDFDIVSDNSNAHIYRISTGSPSSQMLV